MVAWRYRISPFMFHSMSHFFTVLTCKILSVNTLKEKPHISACPSIILYLLEARCDYNDRITMDSTLHISKPYLNPHNNICDRAFCLTFRDIGSGFPLQKLENDSNSNNYWEVSLPVICTGQRRTFPEWKIWVGSCSGRSKPNQKNYLQHKLHWGRPYNSEQIARQWCGFEQWKGAESRADITTDLRIDDG